MRRLVGLGVIVGVVAEAEVLAWGCCGSSLVAESGKVFVSRGGVCASRNGVEGLEVWGDGEGALLRFVRC